MTQSKASVCCVGGFERTFEDRETTIILHSGRSFALSDAELGEFVFQVVRRALPVGSRVPFQVRAMIWRAQAAEVVEP